jgi:predicted RNA-binding Zn-ribbon protein involved in translation (DUF1610 family)
MSFARDNVMKDPSYRPYCMCCNKMPRMIKDLDQFKCPNCFSRTSYEKEFSDKYIKVVNND